MGVHACDSCVSLLFSFLKKLDFMVLLACCCAASNWCMLATHRQVNRHAMCLPFNALVTFQFYGCLFTSIEESLLKG